MFTKDDYTVYFGEVEKLLEKAVTVYTDLLNEASDQSVRSKLYAMLEEAMESYDLVRQDRTLLSL